MSRREEHGVKNSVDGIYLSYSFYESASGHVEETDYVKLSVLNENELVLELYQDELGFLKGMHNHINSVKYKIDADILKKLILENGIKIESK